MLAELTLRAGELVYGLGACLDFVVSEVGADLPVGEQFRSFIKNGRVVSYWDCEGGTSSEETFKWSKWVTFYLVRPSPPSPPPFLLKAQEQPPLGHLR